MEQDDTDMEDVEDVEEAEEVEGKAATSLELPTAEQPVALPEQPLPAQTVS